MNKTQVLRIVENQKKLGGFYMYRNKLSKHKSNQLFKHTANRVRKANIVRQFSRGGISF